MWQLKYCINFPQIYQLFFPYTTWDKYYASTPIHFMVTLFTKYSLLVQKWIFISTESAIIDHVSWDQWHNQTNFDARTYVVNMPLIFRNCTYCGAKHTCIWSHANTRGSGGTPPENWKFDPLRLNLRAFLMISSYSMHN